jgi:hypothetical protein
VTFQDLIQHLQAIGTAPRRRWPSRGYADNFTGDMTTNPTPNRPCITPLASYMRRAAIPARAFYSDVFTTSGSLDNVRQVLQPDGQSSSSGLQAQPSGRDQHVQLAQSSGQAGLGPRIRLV